MDARKKTRWIFIALLIAALLIGVWLAIDFILDGPKPEATPPPQVTPPAEETASPEASETPAATPAGSKLEKDFTLKNLEGEDVTLSDHLGRVTVVNFWGTWCGWCMYEMPEFAEMTAHYGDDVAFLFVNYGDDADTARQAMEEFGIPLSKVLMDSENAVTGLYEIDGYPTTLILDKQGAVVESILGATTKEEVMSIIDGLR